MLIPQCKASKTWGFLLADWKLGYPLGKSRAKKANQKPGDSAVSQVCPVPSNQLIPTTFWTVWPAGHIIVFFVKVTDLCNLLRSRSYLEMNLCKSLDSALALTQNTASSSVRHLENVPRSPVTRDCIMKSHDHLPQSSSSSLLRHCAMPSQCCDSGMQLPSEHWNSSFRHLTGAETERQVSIIRVP